VSKKILLVDDTQTVLMMVSMMLSDEGFQVTEAHDGQEALDLVDSLKPDLVLLDIIMPRLNGVETCRRLKENPKTKDIPVIMMTTKGEPEKVEECFMAGCNDYITKPVDKLELISKIRTYLG
jgi:CheY-like chemotaxis protein